MRLLLPLLVAGLLLAGCYRSSRERDRERDPGDGGIIGLDGAVGDEAGSGDPPDSGGDTLLPADCTPETDPAVEEVCAPLLGAPDTEPGATGPAITSFEWRYHDPCSDGEPTWFELDLELSDPDHATEDLVVCGILMGGGTGFFDATTPTCQIAQTGGDSLNLVVGDPDGNTSRVGTVVYGCSSGTGP